MSVVDRHQTHRSSVDALFTEGLKETRCLSRSSWSTFCRALNAMVGLGVCIFSAGHERYHCIGIGDVTVSDGGLAHWRQHHRGCRGHIPTNILVGGDVIGNIPTNIITYFRI